MKQLRDFSVFYDSKVKLYVLYTVDGLIKQILFKKLITQNPKIKLVS